MLNFKSLAKFHRLGQFRVLSIFARVALVLVLGAVCAPANAAAPYLDCSLSGTGNSLDAGSINVPANAAPGSTIKSIAPVNFTADCSPTVDSTNDKAIFTFAIKTVQPVKGYTDVYPTNIDGIGVRYTFNGPWQCDASKVALANSSVNVTCSGITGSAGSRFSFSLSVTATVVITGATSGGSSSLTTVPVITSKYADYAIWGSSFGLPDLYTGATTGTLTQVTCSVSQPKLTVPLPTVHSSVLSAGVGATAGSQAFALSLQCSPGAKVFITLTDSINPTNLSNTLQLTADSTAKGVGIQLLNAGSPVMFGADSAATGNKNQWLIGDSVAGPMQVPLTARYISTGTVSAGTVKALATFTMSYQ
ncbi:fimbrial protein [Paraburkholderia sp. IW21]|uniref:fimbrial protein n=1 Tax=Paraburkholderia sp. IW21 TaxID=3242488 RepID=UPI00351FB005